MRKQRGNVVLTTIAVVGAIVMLIGVVYVTTYNNITTKEHSAYAEWSEIQNQYQRRHELIPNIVDSTKLYIDYEQELLTDITNARSAWTASLGAGATDQQMEAQMEMNSVFNRLLAVVTTENYPELKADQVVLGLMDELAGTENRIAVARGRYIQAVKAYNLAVSTIPGVLLGRARMPTFEAYPGVDEVPSVAG